MSKKLVPPAPSQPAPPSQKQTAQTNSNGLDNLQDPTLPWNSHVRQKMLGILFPGVPASEIPPDKEIRKKFLTIHYSAQQCLDNLNNQVAEADKQLKNLSKLTLEAAKTLLTDMKKARSDARTRYQVAEAAILNYEQKYEVKKSELPELNSNIVKYKEIYNYDLQNLKALVDNLTKLKTGEQVALEVLTDILPQSK